MKKTIFLYVRGEDYSALEFERRFEEQKVYEDMVAKGETSRIIDEDESYMKIDIVEFGEVDSKFVSFMFCELCDYDHLKSSNIYEVFAK